MKYQKLVFVCSGNTCRSPMAEAAFRKELKRRKIAWYRVQSAGVNAKEGTPMNAEAQKALSEAKIPFSETFKSKRLTQKTVEEAIAVICMTRDLCDLIPGKNVMSFYELTGKDIPDPFGQGIDAYRVTLRKIRECIPTIIGRLGLEVKED